MRRSGWLALVLVLWSGIDAAADVTDDVVEAAQSSRDRGALVAGAAPGPDPKSGADAADAQLEGVTVQGAHTEKARGKALSRHALGLAMDIVSFTGADGRVVAVESDYPKKDWLLLAIENLVDHDKDWRILLTPKNDPISHKDHFHLEASVDFRD